MVTLDRSAKGESVARLSANRHSSEADIGYPPLAVGVLADRPHDAKGSIRTHMKEQFLFLLQGQYFFSFLGTDKALEESVLDLDVLIHIAEGTNGSEGLANQSVIL